VVNTLTQIQQLLFVSCLQGEAFASWCVICSVLGMFAVCQRLYV